MPEGGWRGLPGPLEDALWPLLSLPSHKDNEAETQQSCSYPLLLIPTVMWHAALGPRKGSGRPRRGAPENAGDTMAGGGPGQEGRGMVGIPACCSRGGPTAVLAAQLANDLPSAFPIVSKSPLPLQEKQSFSATKGFCPIPGPQ